MKIKTGTDMIEIERVQKSIENTDGKFCDRVYTANEIKYCESKNVQKYQHYAARFAVKEATFKAISDLLKDKYCINWQNVETIVKENGKPKINFIDLNMEVQRELEKIKSIDVSISHIEKLAIANVTILI